MPETVKRVIAARVTFELICEGNIGDVEEKYQILFNNAEKNAKGLQRRYNYADLPRRKNRPVLQ
jgi:hypothetical protein